jgi:hypothetical protein
MTMLSLLVLIVASGALWWHWRVAASTDDIEHRLTQLERDRQDS